MSDEPRKPTTPSRPARSPMLSAEDQALVRKIALRIKHTMNLRCDDDDLIAFGYEGLLDAQAKFDASRGASFETYAYYRIRGAIIDGVRRMAYVPRSAYGELRAAQVLEESLEHEGTRRGAHPELRRDAVATLTAIDDTLARFTTAFALAHVGHADQTAEADQERSLVERETHAQIREALAGLSSDQARIIQALYFEERTIADVARDLGLSPSWASRLHQATLDRLRRALARKVRP